MSEDSSMSDSKRPDVENVVIIGSGAAGLTAAIYTSRAELNPTLIEGEQPGGQLTITSDVENFPGFSDPVHGPHLMETIRTQALKFGTHMIQSSVTEIDCKSNPKIIKLSDDSVIKTKAIIVATGAVAKWLDIPGEEELKGKGVSACATCDGAFFKKREIAVVGGGDTALEEATFLTRYASSVTLIHRRDQLRGSAAMVKKAKGNPKIKFQWNTAMKEVHGDAKGNVTALTWKNVTSGEEEKVPMQGLFVAIGHTPNSMLFKGQLPMDENGYLLHNDKNTGTAVEGVFVAGDVADHVYRQAVTAAGMGCQAAIDCQHYLESLE